MPPPSMAGTILTMMMKKTSLEAGAIKGTIISAAAEKAREEVSGFSVSAWMTPQDKADGGGGMKGVSDSLTLDSAAKTGWPAGNNVNANTNANASPRGILKVVVTEPKATVPAVVDAAAAKASPPTTSRSLSFAAVETTAALTPRKAANSSASETFDKMDEILKKIKEDRVGGTTAVTDSNSSVVENNTHAEEDRFFSSDKIMSYAEMTSASASATTATDEAEDGNAELSSSISAIRVQSSSPLRPPDDAEARGSKKTAARLAQLLSFDVSQSLFEGDEDDDENDVEAGYLIRDVRRTIAGLKADQINKSLVPKHIEIENFLANMRMVTAGEAGSQAEMAADAAGDDGKAATEAGAVDGPAAAVVVDVVAVPTVLGAATPITEEPKAANLERVPVISVMMRSEQSTPPRAVGAAGATAPTSPARFGASPLTLRTAASAAAATTAAAANAAPFTLPTGTTIGGLRTAVAAIGAKVNGGPTSSSPTARSQFVIKNPFDNR